MDLLDESKENVQPLKRGRNMSTLSTALQAQTDTDIYQQLMKEREQFEVLVRSYSGDDPLKPWYDYVQWVEQNFPKHGKEGNLKVLLENCLVEFKDCEQYSQDVRYIDLWTRYMSFSDKPLEMYKQIHAHGIGAHCAIFYLCWAEEFELSHDMKRADQVYIEGIKRNAQPLEELKAAHNDFQVRVARNVLGQNPLADEELCIEGRTALSTLRAQGRKRNLVDSSRVGNSILRPTPGILRPHSNVLQVDKRNGNSQSKISVYNDENAVFPDAFASTNMKPPVNIKKEKPNKENTMHPGKWNVGKFAKRNSIVTSGFSNTPSAMVRGPTFSVHADENISTPKTHTDIVVSNVLKERRQVYEDEKCIPIALFEPPDPTKKAMYPKKKVYSGGAEFSLEELRAIIYMKRCRNKSDEQIKTETLEISRNSERGYSNAEGKKEHSDTNVCVPSDNKSDYVNICNNHKNGVVNVGSFNHNYLKKPPFDLANASQDLRLSAESIEEQLKRIPVALFELPDPSKLPMYPKNKVYCNDTEYSLEELRADIYYKRLKRKNETMINSVTSQTEFLCIDPTQKVLGSSNPKISEASLQKFGLASDINYFKIGVTNVESVEKNEKNPNFGIFVEEKEKKQSFEIFVEDEKEINAKMKQNESSVETEPKIKKFTSTLPSLSKELPFSGCLKVPKLLKERKAPNELFLDCTSTSDNKESDQSFTVNTRAVMNEVKDMWVSSPPISKPVKTSVVSIPTHTSEKINIEDMGPTPQKGVMPFKIFSDLTDSRQKNVESMSAPSESSKFDKACGTIEAKANSLRDSHVQLPYSEQNLENPESHPRSQDLETPKSAFKIYADSFVEQPESAIAPTTIPIVRSPGMTNKQIAAMEGTDNKENELIQKPKEGVENKETSKKKLCFPGGVNTKGILTPSKDIYFEPLEKQAEVMEMDQENAFSDETCCTEAFAKPLVSSTPMIQPVLHPCVKYSNQDQKEDEDNTMYLMNIPRMKKGVDSEALQNNVLGDCFSDPSPENVDEVKPSYIASHLSIIYELPENKKSRSLGESSKSSEVDTLHKISKFSPTCLQVAELEEELQELEVDFRLSGKDSNTLSYDQPFNFYSDNFRSTCLKNTNFPSEKHRNHCMLVYDDWNRSDGGEILIDNTIYTVLKVSSGVDDRHDILAYEMESRKHIIIRTENVLNVWDHYIKEEIRLRLKDSSMVHHFVTEDKTYIFNNVIVTISPRCEAITLQDLLIQPYAEADNVMSEPKVLCLVCKILSIVLQLHQCNIAHGNISVNSFLVRNMTGRDYYLILTDYGKAVDVLYPSCSVFDVSENTVFRKLNTLKVGPFQVDYIGLANLLHCIIFNKPLEVRECHGKWRVSTPLPRGFKNIWNTFFEDLLNSSLVDLLQYHNSLHQILGFNIGRNSLTPAKLLI